MNGVLKGLCGLPDRDWMDMGMKGSANSSTGCRRLLRDLELLLLRMQLSSTSLKLAPRDASFWPWPPSSPLPPSCSRHTRHQPYVRRR